MNIIESLKAQTMNDIREYLKEPKNTRGSPSFICGKLSALSYIGAIYDGQYLIFSELLWGGPEAARAQAKRLRYR